MKNSLRTAYFGLRFGTWVILLCLVLVLAGAAGAGQGAVVVLDPGHGGVDPGAVDEANGILEKTINLQVAQKMRAHLEAAGHTVVMTRDGDDTFCRTAGGGFAKRWVSLEERVALANDRAADLFISIHANSFHDRRCAGPEIFYHRTSGAGQALAEAFRTALHAARPSLGCRVKPANYYVLRGTNMPAVLLEIGYLSNEEEAKKLLDPGYQEELAAVFAAAADRYLAGGRWD